MRITQWGEYGVLCSLFLARNDQESSHGAQEIADSQNIPLPYCQQILHRLKCGGIVHSQRGRNGGYRLARSPELINLAEILEAVEGDLFEVMCDTRPVFDNLCNDSEFHCSLKVVWKEVESKLREILESHTLRSLLDDFGSTGLEQATELVCIKNLRQAAEMS